MAEKHEPVYQMMSLKVGDRRLSAARSKRALSRCGIALAVAAAMTACTTVGPDFERPKVRLQQRWSTQAVTSAKSVSNWWSSFHDHTLDALIEASLAGNPTLQSAAVHIQQAEFQLRVTRLGLLPQIQAVTSDDFSKPDPRSQLLGKTLGSSTLQAEFQASWEIDFWGATRRAIESDRATLESDIASYQAARTSLIASVASAYIDARTLEHRIEVANENLAQQAESLRIARARFHAGESSELDLRQAETQYRLTQSQLPSMDATLDQTWDAICVLAGQPPRDCQSTFRGTKTTPEQPKVIPLGMPLDLLRRRPDVVQAERAAAAQSARIGQSQAALYPSFTLSGAFGLAATDAGTEHLNDIFSWSSRTLSLGGGLVMPIFDRGKLVAQVKVQDALFRQSVLAYQNQVLKAQQEVEDALASMRGNTDAADFLLRARDGAQRAAALALQRYKSGESDYTTVTAAEQSRLQVEDSYAIAQGNAKQSVVSVYRAIGGGWDGVLAEAVPKAQDSAAIASSVAPSTPRTVDLVPSSNR